ncbi:STP1 protein [Plasmodium ovale]|uniref:STP1 protein n=1 Tax=Plasmodium ovale TaxID=36330 RepID=A0A1C3KKQ4_PLAOA|nr:STP1 protein [Plasmodium ovale]
MAEGSGYTALTRYIDINFFKAMIESDIKKFIHTYGHKKCGLRQEELCEKIKNIISEKKKIIFELMDTPSKKKWSPEWDSERSKYFNKLYDDEGFINMCFPKTYPKKNQILNQLLSKHIEFCKEKDQRLSVIGKNREYSVCLEYNKWIIAEGASFTSEYLQNVKIYKINTVKKFFSTKKHPEGYNPLTTYRNIRLDCEIYNPASERYQPIPVDNAPTKSLHSPTAPDVGQESQGKDGKSMPDRDGTPNGQHTGLKAKGAGPPIIAQVATGKPTEASDAKAKSPQQLTEPPSSISPKDSPVDKVLDPLPSVTIDQGTSDKTPSTTSSTYDATYSTQNVTSPSAPDLSLPQSQLPALVTIPSQHQTEDTSQYTKELITPDTVIESTDQGTPSTSALDPHSSLDPGLVSTPATASNSSASATLSTTVSTTSASTAGSSSDQDLRLIKLTPQSTTTTHISTTSVLTQTTTAMLDPSPTTVSAVSTKPISGITEITSTTNEHGKPKASAKTVLDPPYPNFVSTKRQDDTIQPPTNVPSPDERANLNMNQHPGQPPDPPSVLSADGNKITTSFRDPSQQFKDTTLVSSTSLPEGAQPSNKPSITPTNFLPLTSIIPTIYTPFGLLLGRRRKRKKRDLRSTFVIPEESTYESPNIALHEWEDPKLVGKTVEKDVYIKLLKINRYKQEMQNRKKKNKKTLIEVHMEVLEEHKNDEWELHKGDFLEICLRGFINDENDFYSNFPNSKLIVNNIKNEKTIEDIQNHEILWNNWIEDHRNILEEWKKEDWFHILKNKWRNEEQIYKEKNHKLQENMLNEQETYSIVSQKDMWKQWISKQAALIDMFNKEDWFKSIAHAQNKEKDNYHINEYNNITVTNENQLKNEKVNHELGRSKNIIQKLMVQIHMMVLEECIKEDIIKHKELCIDNFIEDIHNENNYEEKRNMPQSDIDNFKVPEFEEIHTSKNK